VVGGIAAPPIGRTAVAIELIAAPAIGLILAPPVGLIPAPPWRVIVGVRPIRRGRGRRRRGPIAWRGRPARRTCSGGARCVRWVLAVGCVR